MTDNLNYVSYDFSDLVLQLQNRLRSKDTWKDIYRSGTGEMLIEFLAYVLNLGLFYTERRAEESYLPTARLRSSVVNLVKLLNYEPKRKSSATGKLTFSIDSPLDKIVYIPKYTECQSEDGLQYITNEDGAIGKGQTSVIVKAIQGKVNRTFITSNGSVSQEYKISNSSVENSGDLNNLTFRIVVDGVEWMKVSSFLYSINVDTHYRVINEMDDTVSVLFGDDINGRSPDAGSTIVIQYVESAGSTGNVTYIGKITTVSSTIYDEDGGAVSINVTNESSFLGGDDEEDIEEIRYEAPRVFKTGERAVTAGDFIAFLENYPGVANVNVWGENEEAELEGVDAVQSMLNKVKMSILLQSWVLPDDSFKSTLSEYIYDRSMLTVKYEFVDPVILNVIPTLVVKVTTGSSMSQAQTDIDVVVAGKFVLGNTTKLGTIIKYSEVISAIHDLTNVAYVSGVLEIKKELSDAYDSFYDYGATLEATNILPRSVRLFIDGNYVTKDSDNEDGTGSFSSAGGYTLSGTINYSTGVLVLDVNPTPSESIYVRYQQDENGNIKTTFRQICKLDLVDIQSISME